MQVGLGAPCQHACLPSVCVVSHPKGSNNKADKGCREKSSKLHMLRMPSSKVASMRWTITSKTTWHWTNMTHAGPVDCNAMQPV